MESRKRAGGLDTSTADGYAAWQRQGYRYDPPQPTVEVTTFADEPDRASIKANGMVVDVIANDDGSLYVECYAYEGRASQAVVESAFIDRYTNRHPNFRMRVAERTHQFVKGQGGVVLPTDQCAECRTEWRNHA